MTEAFVAAAISAHTIPTALQVDITMSSVSSSDPLAVDAKKTAVKHISIATSSILLIVLFRRKKVSKLTMKGLV